jgi:phage N-6-adenine-methyltransferase
MINPGLMSSRIPEWGTPGDFFRELDGEFGFDLDVCAVAVAVAANAKCDRYFSPEQDGLSRPWSGTCWMNPPYGRKIGLWIRKAWDSSRIGSVVVCLVPSRTDTAWFHDYCLRGEIRFIRCRLYFEGPTADRAPFPSAIVIFRPPAPVSLPLK